MSTDSNKKGFGCGSLMAVAFCLLYLIGILLPDQDAAKTSSRYEAGHQIGFLDGNMAYNGGRLKPNDAQLDAAARRITAGVKFPRPEERDDWIRGYKNGFWSGWSAR